IEITEFGIYTSHTDESIDEAGTATGTRNLLSDIALERSTTTVPARLGVEFGFRYRIVGKHDDAVVKLKKITHIPAPGIHNPETGNISVTSTYFVERKIGEESYTGYKLSHSWEIVPGTWALELWDGRRKLVSKSFHLVKKR